VPDPRRQPGAAVRELEIGERLDARDPPGVLQVPDGTAEIQARLSDRRGERRPPAESESTVNVTIGRIDIRAVGKERQHRTSRATAPSRIMSLEDYLQKRDGRRR
jgi:hypothetical protein